MNAKTGFSPTTGLQYVYATPKILFVLAPGILLTTDYNLQGVAVFEYKPQLLPNWKLYSRLQGFYNQNTREGYHQRSYIVARLGLSHKLTDVGLGANLDWYGSARLYKENFGLFLRYSFL